MSKHLLIVLVTILLGCGRSIPDFVVQNDADPSGTWMVYEGSLPCADCSEIKTRLEIKIDYANPEPPFIIKQAFLGKRGEDEAAIDHGVYGTLKVTFRENDATAYELNPGNPKKTMYFLRVHEDTLKLLDQNLKEIQSDLNYTLIRKK